MKVCQQCSTVYYGAEVFCNKDGARLGGTGQLPVETQQALADPLIGKSIQRRYRVLCKLGEGGMGVVYTALHVDIEKKVAIKVLRDDFSKRPEVVERFRQEARAASRIGHANIVDVTDFGQLEEGGVFFAMELLQGVPLADEVRGKCLPLLRAVPIINQICRALSAAHKVGIVHRDLKPENIFLVEKDDQHDFVKILDFGIAKISDQDSDGKRLTKTGMIFGTPEYMSPEQASGKPLDHRVDVYALGCIMFEMFTGAVPYTGESFMAVLTQHMFEPVPLIEEVNPQTDVPPAVREVVYRAMSKDLRERYANMASLEVDLERALIEEDYVVERSDLYSGLIRVSDPRIGGLDPGRKPKATSTRMEIAGSRPLTGDVDVKRRRNVLLGILGGLVVILAGAGFLFGTGALDSILKKEQTVETQVLSTVQSAESPQDGIDEETQTEELPALETDGKIVVRIETEPPGAIVKIEGKGQVCSAAPCDVSMEGETTAILEASLDKKTGKMTFTPSAQNKTVRIKLKEAEETGGKARGKRRGQRSKEEGSGSEPAQPSKPANEGAGASPDGLKIPEYFRDK